MRTEELVETVQITVVRDENGKSCLARDELPFNGAPGEVQVTSFVDATRIGYLRMPAGYSSEWHNAPRKQYVMVLQGIMSLRVSNGEEIDVKPGTILRVEDTTGQGHCTWDGGGDGVFLCWVPVP
jgi:quercetin dioxygenase-like cupin family protein